MKLQPYLLTRISNHTQDVVMSKTSLPGRSAPISFVVEGECASKANSRRIVRIGNRVASIKSKKAMGFSEEFILQCPVVDPLFEDDVHADITIFYGSRKPDLDESLVLDLMQGRIYRNDRQVRSRRTRWGLCKTRPRVEITVRLMESSDCPSG